jgi:hypothetical protein
MYHWGATNTKKHGVAYSLVFTYVCPETAKDAGWQVHTLSDQCSAALICKELGIQCLTWNCSWL